MLKDIWQDIKHADRGWLLIWGLIYAGFIAGDILVPGFIGTTFLKLLGLFTCFVYACHKTPRARLLLIALGLTILADILLAIDNASPWGVLVFCFVHFFHMARLTNIDYKTHHLLRAYLIGAGLIFIFGIMIQLPVLIVLGAIYAVTLTSNLLLSARWYRQNRQNQSARHSFAGFLLFIACDICVAISYLASIHFFWPPLYYIAGAFVWPFYFPSQILICSSGKTVIK